MRISDLSSDVCSSDLFVGCTVGPRPLPGADYALCPGNVPLYLREVLLEHMPEYWSIHDACEAFNREKEDTVRRATITHYNGLADSGADELLEYVFQIFRMPCEGLAAIYAFWCAAQLLVAGGSAREATKQAQS